MKSDRREFFETMGVGAVGVGLISPEKGEVMVLNDVCEVKNDPDREARKALPAI